MWASLRHSRCANNSNPVGPFPPHFFKKRALSAPVLRGGTVRLHMAWRRKRYPGQCSMEHTGRWSQSDSIVGACGHLPTGEHGSRPVGARAPSPPHRSQSLRPGASEHLYRRGPGGPFPWPSGLSQHKSPTYIRKGEVKGGTASLAEPGPQRNLGVVSAVKSRAMVSVELQLSSQTPRHATPRHFTHRKLCACPSRRLGLWAPGDIDL